MVQLTIWRAERTNVPGLQNDPLQRVARTVLAQRTFDLRTETLVDMRAWGQSIRVAGPTQTAEEFVAKFPGEQPLP